MTQQLSEYTLVELWKLSNNVNYELFRRIWWVWAIIFAGGGLLVIFCNKDKK